MSSLSRQLLSLGGSAAGMEIIYGVAASSTAFYIGGGGAAIVIPKLDSVPIVTNDYVAILKVGADMLVIGAVHDGSNDLNLKGQAQIEVESTGQEAIKVIPDSTGDRPYLAIYGWNGSAYERRSFWGYPEVGTTAGDVTIFSDTGDLVVGAKSGYQVAVPSNNTVKAAGMPFVELRHSASFNVSNAGTGVVAPWNTTVSDAWGLKSGNAIRVNYSGRWMFTATTVTDNVNVEGARQLFFYRNDATPDINTTNERYGGDTHGNLGSGALYGSLGISTVMDLDQADNIGVIAYQVTGATRTWSLSGRKDLSGFSAQLLWAK